MKARMTFAALSAGAIALAMLAPVAVQAAPKRPDGQAFVRVEGGTAYAVKKSGKEYRVVVPDGVDISWMGVVNGRTGVGTFTPSALVTGWTRLGFRDGRRALTTVSWVEPGGKKSSNVLVRLTRPRINGDGQLTFLAYSKHTALPKELPGFSLNVAMANPFARTQPRDTSFQSFTINPDGSSAVAVTESGNTTAYIKWASYNGSPACPPQLKVQTGTTKNFGGNCGNGHIDNQYGIQGNYSTIVLSGASNGVYGTVTMKFGYTPTGDKQFVFNHIVAQWDTNGNNTM